MDATTIPPTTTEQQMNAIYQAARPHYVIPLPATGERRGVLAAPDEANDVIKRVTDVLGWLPAGEMTSRRRNLGGREWALVVFEYRPYRSRLLA